MRLCYIDESGDPGPFNPEDRNSQPVFVLAALFVQHSQIPALTQAIVNLKKRFFPSYGNKEMHWHDWLKVEVKGANLRRAVRERNRDSLRHFIGFLDHVLALFERHHIQLVARIYLKHPGEAFNGVSIYSAAVQHLATAFEVSLSQEEEEGVIILDSRTKNKNVPVAHSVFTMNTSGRKFPHLAEVPLFGHSDNHAGLQLADWIASALLFPMATRAYYSSLEETCVHADASLEAIRTRFGQRLKKLQFRYERAGRRFGGIAVLGGEAHHTHSVQLFGDAVKKKSAPKLTF